MMDLRRLTDELLPGAERDPKFREYLAQVAASSLRPLAVLEIAAPLLLYFGHFAAGQESGIAAARLVQTGAMALAGLATLALSAAPWGRRHARLVAAVSAWAAPALLVWMMAWRPTAAGGADDYIPAAVTLVILTAVTTIPFLPWHALALGFAVEGVYILASWFGRRWGVSSPALSPGHDVFLVLLALLAAGIAAAHYRRRMAEFEAQQEALRVAEALAGAQLRAQLAESAISVGKLAAALAHEINSPLGALRSSISTLIALTDRQVESTSPEKRDLLAKMRGDLGRSIEESAARIDDVMGRLRRFVNLEEADLKSADINDLLSDVALLYAQQLESGRIRLEFDLEKALPPLTCRPQLLTAVFSSLLSNAINAVNGEGRIRITTRRLPSDVEITIQDNGRGMTPEEVDDIFDPVFKVAENRVSSGNWSLFNTRQIVYEHGGDIRIDTAKGGGAAFHVTLPV
jgi:signal transduction histidine kinase